jgi:riboflavin synthase
LSNFSSEINAGDSIAVNGICLTAVSSNEDSFNVNVVNETIKKTNLIELKELMYVNLERAVSVSSRMNGHVVQGHIESLAVINRKEKLSLQTDLTVKIDKEYLKYCIYKGSITLDGISLTIASINNNEITVAIIPHTLENTTLKYREIGDTLNLETDVFAKYVENIISYKD